MQIFPIIDPYAIHRDSFAGDVYTLDTAGITLTAGALTAGYANITDESNGYQVDGRRALSIKSVGADFNLFLGPSGNFTMTGTQNYFAGWFSGNSITSGGKNIGIGYGTLNANTEGAYNTALGFDALRKNTTGSNNVAIGGLESLYSNTTGDENIGLGEDALRGNTTGSNNIGIGYKTGLNKQTGSGNIFIGYSAGLNQTSIDNLLIIDNQDRGSIANEVSKALIYGVFDADPANQSITINGALNAGIGTFSNLNIEGAIPILVFKDTTDTGDGARGFQEWRDSNNARLGFFGNSSYTHDDLVWKNESSGGHLLLETTGTGIVSSNTDFTTTGAITGTSLTLPNTISDATGVIYKSTDRFIHNFQHPTGDEEVPTGKNTFVGVNAGNFEMGSTATETYHGSKNNAIGYDALRSNTTGYGNNAIGYGVLRSNTTGYGNNAMGSESLYDNTLGYGNTAVGEGAGRFLTTGDRNVFLGRGAGARQTDGNDLLIIDSRSRADAATEATNSIIYGTIAAAPADQTLRINAVLNVTEDIQVDGTQVVTNQQAHIVDAPGDTAANNATTINAILVALETHGLLAAA